MIGDHTQEYSLKIATAPLLDLMDISGYAFLYSDYHGNPSLAEPVTKAWDVYIDTYRDTPMPPLLPLLAAAVTLTESSFGLAHRSFVRTKWRQNFSRRTKDLPTKRVYRRRMIPLEGIVVHNSPFVRLYAHHHRHRTLNDGINIFILRYIRSREDGKDVDFGTRRRDLRDSIEREEKMYEELMSVHDAQG